jgi:glyoxylase-like metal-dependent hydrolase (beta-lactamase superfamily II)
MLRTSILAAALLSLAALVGSTPASVRAAESQEMGKLEQVIPGHYVYSTGARISGIIATNDGVVVVDALSNEAMAKHERQLIANTIKQPVRYLISSTFHGNYSLGNVAYQDAVRIGSESYRTDLMDMMKQDNTPPQQQAAIMPHQTFRDRMTIYLGGKEIQLLFLGRAHTRGDAVVFVPQDRIVYLSEVFFDGRFPFMNDGYVEWIKTIDAVLNLPADIFVPGQGPSDIAKNPRGSKDALIRARKVLTDFRDSVQAEIAKGSTEEQTAAAVLLPQYRNMVGYDQQRATTVRRIYRDLKGTLKD